MFGKTKGNATRTLDRLLADVEHVATQLAELRGERSTLELERRVEQLSRQRDELNQAVADLRAEKARGELEIEHKLGLHRQQVESERRIMLAEAEAERLRAVEQAKLAVREENLSAERERFEQEIAFRTERFEAEAATLRSLTEQVLARLPNVTATYSHTVEHAPRELPAGDDT